MVLIDKIEIRYFRSAYSITLKDIKPVQVFAGKNDSGKSNIVKALNLFFMNQTDWNTPFNFSTDFSKQRRAEARKVKGKQFIQVSITFKRGDDYQRSLPESFTVKRKWNRDSVTFIQTSDIERQFKKGKVPTKTLKRANASLQMYLNRIRFEYIPAIKDQHFFVYVLGLLQDIIFEKKSDESNIAESVKALNSSVEQEAKLLGKEFLKASNVDTKIRLPEKLDELFRAFTVVTKFKSDDMPLGARGDGIRARFIPSLLYYISRNSRFHYIWGFEEPENSLEHGLATKLASDIVEIYYNSAQMFITSHSPAFFGLRSDRVSVCHVCAAPDSVGTSCIPYDRERLENQGLYTSLEEDLGLMELQEKFQLQYKERMIEIQKEKSNYQTLSEKLKQAAQPVILTEGKGMC